MKLRHQRPHCCVLVLWSGNLSQDIPTSSIECPLRLWGAQGQIPRKERSETDPGSGVTEENMRSFENQWHFDTNCLSCSCNNYRIAAIHAKDIQVFLEGDNFATTCRTKQPFVSSSKRLKRHVRNTSVYIQYFFCKDLPWDFSAQQTRLVFETLGGGNVKGKDGSVLAWWCNVVCTLPACKRCESKVAWRTPKSDGLQPTSDGLQSTRHGLETQ